MNPRCRAQLNSARVAAGGKPLSNAQVKNIDDRMRATMRRLARTDPAWQTYTADQRMLLGAQQAVQDIADEAARKVANAQRQALKSAELEQRIIQNRARTNGDRHSALTTDYHQSDAYITGIKRDSARQMMDLIEASKSGQGAGIGRRVLMALFDAENPAMTRDLALEVYAKGQAGTGNAIAKAAADVWLKVTDGMRQRFNAAGGDVGKLDYGYLPQAHDQARVLAKGRDQWAAEVLPMIDRARYVKEDGARMTDVEVLDVLRGAWDTISSGGANKRAPGANQGTGARANRGSESREIHFKDGDAYLQYLRDYGTGSMYDAMIGHIGGLSRDIGLVERYGPNPEAQMRVQFDLAERADGKRWTDNIAGPQAQWRVLSGASGQAEHASVAQVGQTIRNIETFGKLQGALLSSITDIGTFFVTVGYNRLGYWQAIKDVFSANASGGRDFLNAHGMMADSLISDLNRWSGDNVANNWSGRIANSTMKLSLMNAWTDSLRRAYSMTHMRALGKLADTAWQSLDAGDRWRLEQKGITDADWALMQSAKMQTPYGQMVTPEALHATADPRAGEVAAKLIGLITDESEMAVLNPDLLTRTITSGGGAARGSVGGELARAVMQFKSFPIAMMTRHWARMLEVQPGTGRAQTAANRLAYGGALMASLTILGAIAFQTKQMVSGKDPVPMDSPKFWTRAFAQGGGAGFLGDMLLSDTTDDRSPMDTFGRAFLGPTFGSAADVYALTKGNIDQAMAGKSTHAGAETVRFVRSHTPLVNLWYGKAALDHAALHAVQENLSPGYLSRIRSKQRKDWQTGWWWAPGEDLPQRPPDLSNATGR